MVYNFDVTQTALASVAINTLAIEEWRSGTFKNPPRGPPRYGVCFVKDDNVVSSVRALCETILDTNNYPAGLAYVSNMGWHLQVGTTMEQEQIREICEMVRTSNGKRRLLLGGLERQIAF
jgi:hypothetical protein